MIVHLWSTQFWHKGSCYAASMVQKLSLLKRYFPLLVVLALHNCLACAFRFVSPLCLNWSEPEPRIWRDWESIWYSMLELGLSWALGEVKYVQPPRRNLAAAWLVLPRCAGRIQCPVHRWTELCSSPKESTRRSVLFVVLWWFLDGVRKKWWGMGKLWC